MAKQNSNVLISSIYNSRKNILDLMYKQNYNIDEYSNFSINEVNSMFQNNQLDIKLEKNNKENKAYIHYYLGKTAKTITRAGTTSQVNARERSFTSKRRKGPIENRNLKTSGGPQTS